MNTTDPEVREYLAELRRALAGRTEAERELVVDGVRQHIDDAVAGGAPVLQVLEDLGDPLVIAADPDGADRPAPPLRPPFLDRRGGSVLVTLLLAFGGIVVPVAGWIAGVVLLWLSHGWRTVDKVIGTIAPVLGAGLLLAAAAAARASVLGFAPVHAAVLVGPLVGAVLGAVYLLLRFRTAQ